MHSALHPDESVNNTNNNNENCDNNKKDAVKTDSNAIIVAP